MRLKYDYRPLDKKILQGVGEYIGSEEDICAGLCYEQQRALAKKDVVVLAPSRLHLVEIATLGKPKNHRSIPLSEIRSYEVKKGKRIPRIMVVWWLISQITTRRLILETAQGETIDLVFNIHSYRNIPQQICDYLSTVADVKKP